MATPKTTSLPPEINIQIRNQVRFRFPRLPALQKPIPNSPPNDGHLHPQSVEVDVAVAVAVAAAIAADVAVASMMLLLCP